MFGWAGRFLGAAADRIWPRVCAVETCSRPSDRPGRYVCSECFAGLPFHGADGCCRICGTTIASKVHHEFVCEVCATTPPPNELARSAALYDAPVDQLVNDFKFRRAVWLANDLADLLEGAVRAKLDFSAIDVIVPVPLSRERFRERGYNQSALLARALGLRLGRRVDERSFHRIRDTEHQSRLSGEERAKNLEGAFKTVDTRYIRGRTVLIVDDVMTSGNTFSFCAKALLEGGAARVWCASVARRLREG